MNDLGKPPQRGVARVIRGLETSDGGGVRLTRIIGSGRLPQLDPFLLLDAFRSSDPDDYIAGFPPHPHRGFETVTYLIAGHMRHRDNAGHEGRIESGGAQWMNTGSGIVHSEMPEQEEGLLFGFQLWVNLPARRKREPAGYRDLQAQAIPVETRAGATVRVLAGTTAAGTTGPIGELLGTEVLYLDVTLQPGAGLHQPLAPEYNGFVHPFEGRVRLADTDLRAGDLAVLGPGGAVALRAGDEGARLLLVGGRPLNEPVARHGPFVMNTQEEILQAFADYRDGRLGA